MKPEAVASDFDHDVIIVGAGLSGLSYAYRLHESNPELDVWIVERQSQIGGTWSFFKYPGLRSDSDLHTFGFPWFPWTEVESIAQAPAILRYMQKAAAQYGLDRRISYNTKVVSMEWSSDTAIWTLSIHHEGEEANRKTLKSRFVCLASGYYDYDEPLQADIPYLDSFQGPVIHPQFWPSEYDYRDNSVVIIGSGATAITMLPNMASEAKHVTMLQRSPGYIMSVPQEDWMENAIRSWSPAAWAPLLLRLKCIVYPAFFRNFCLYFPSIARKMLNKATQAQLASDETLDPNFTPKYNPFEQRLCMSPNGDFYDCLRAGKASIKTGVICRVESDGILLQSGEKLSTDMIVTATGLKLVLGGKIDISVDGKTFHMPDHHVWKGVMIDDLPNLTFSLGYTTDSWTLGADATAQITSRILKQMVEDSVTTVVPRVDKTAANVQDLPLLGLKSTYVLRGAAGMPKARDCPQWRPRKGYLWDYFSIKFGDISTGLEWIKDSSLHQRWRRS